MSATTTSRCLTLSGKKPAPRAELPASTVIPPFLLSELRPSFEIGFLQLPLLVIDIAVTGVLLAMGVMMLPPAAISLPMEIIFFVLVEGWALVAKSLFKSFGGRV